MPMSAGQWLLLLALSVLWGGSFFMVEIALREAAPMTIVFARVSIAAAVLWAVVAMRRRWVNPGWRVWGLLVVMGGFNNVLPFFLIVHGQATIDSGMAAICNATVPLFTVLLAHFCTTDERLSWSRVGGVVVGLLGVAALVGPQAFGNMLTAGASVGEYTLGQLAVLGASVSYAIAALFGQRFRALPPLTAAAGMLTGSTALMLPLMLSVARPPSLDFGLSAWAALVGIAVISTAGAYLVYFRLLATAGATNLMLVTFVIPIIAIALGILFLGETLQAQTVAGMGLIFAGLLLIDGRAVGWLRRR